MTMYRDPFPDDDPFLPSRDAPIGYCAICGQEHRLDLGCPMTTIVTRSSDRAARRMLLAVLMVFAGLAGWGAWWGTHQ